LNLQILQLDSPLPSACVCSEQLDNTELPPVSNFDLRLEYLNYLTSKQPHNRLNKQIQFMAGKGDIL